VCDSQLRLLEAQRVLERETAAAEHKAAAQTSASAPASAPASASVSASAPRFRFVDLPLNATVLRCFSCGLSEQAEALRVEFRVPEKRWWRLKLAGLSQAHAWEELWRFSQARRAPISLRLFAEACIEHDAPAEAERYVRRLPPAEAVPLLLRIGAVDGARRLAAANKEKMPELLKLVAEHERG